MQARKFIFSGLFATLMMIVFVLSSRAPLAAAPSSQSNVKGPFTLTSIQVASFDGDVRRLPTLRANTPNVEREAPRPRQRNSVPNAAPPTAPRAPSNQPAAASLAPRGLTPLQDFDYRWIGSLALDREGNMALGYSVSSAGMYPAIVILDE